MEIAMGNASAYASNFGAGGFGANLWQELLPGRNGEPVHDLLKEQYDVIYGRWPQAYNEIMVVVNSRNEVSDLGLFALGLKSMEEMKEITEASLRGEQIPIDVSRWTYEEMCNHTVRLVLSSSYWQPNGLTGTYIDLSQTETGRDYLFDNGIELKVVGIIRPSENASATMLTGSVVYTSALTEYIMDETAKADAVLAQKKDTATDIFTGLPFLTDNDRNLTAAQKAQRLKDWMPGRTVAQKAEMYVDYAAIPSAEWLNTTLAQQLTGLSRADLEERMIAAATESTGMSADKLKEYFAQMDEETFMGYVRAMMAEQLTEQYAAGVRQQLAAMPMEQLAGMLDAQLASADEATLANMYDTYEDRMYSTSTLEENLEVLGCVDEEHPTSINLYASTFEAKDQISDKIDAYNATLDEDDRIIYTDYVALLMSSFTTILNAISYVLIAFVAISLVVSSIMIGIITYISVLERTKEIGILRAIGASKKDIARVFNAEALIVGFAAGAIGIGVTLLLNMLINVILHALTGIPNLNAVLPAAGGFILVAISMILTFIAGLIPSRIAAKKDPVVALRTE
ncbi:MAG: ABC transporter permease, partial [Clostridia bacterium]|nr:ABC transporter permease [Clostridia bacterium]